MSAVTKLRWVEVSESDASDDHKGSVAVSRREWEVTNYFKLQAYVLTESGLQWVDVPIEWKP